MGRTGIYGGTFNPPHNGHLLAAREAVRTLQLDRVIFIPAAQPPHKQMPAGSPDGRTRMALLEQAVSGLPWAEVSSMELDRNGPSYTADTLRILAAQRPDDTLYLLMGTDMFLSLHTWYKPEVICSLAVIVLCVRDAADDEKLESIRRQKKLLEKRFHAEVLIPDTAFTDISSTMVRRMLVFRCAGTFLPEGLPEMIQAQGLYGTGRDLRNLPFPELREVSLSLHRPKRAVHADGVCKTAVELARHWGENETDAARAGILHDVTKALEREEQLRLCEKYGIITDAFEQANYKLLHARTGAAVAEHIFGENEAVCNAIYWHTTGRAGMTTMEKILYLADYTEPGRDFAGVDTLRTLSFQNLDEAMLLGLEMSIAELEQENKPVGPWSVQARDWFRSRKEREA